MFMNFDALVGRSLPFFGVRNDTTRETGCGGSGWEAELRLAHMVWKVSGYAPDEWRSYLEDVERLLVENQDGFSSKALALVRVERVDRGGFARTEADPLVNVDSGYRLVDQDGHVWLEFGTDNEDDWYPGFVWDYRPKN